MKILSRTLFLVLSLSVALTSCKKEEAAAEEPISDDETAELIESIISTENGGASEEYKSSSQIAVEEFPAYQYVCTYAGDTAMYRAFTGVRTFEVSSALNWFATCTNNEVTSLTFEMSNQSTYDGPALSRSGNSTGQFVLSNLAMSYSELMMAGTLSTTGNVNFGNKTTETAVDMSFVNVAIDKSSFEMVSGTAQVNVTATLNGTTVTKSALVTFNGNMATIVINGNTYTFTMY